MLAILGSVRALRVRRPIESARMRFLRVLPSMLLAGLLLTACGNKGDLLPPAPQSGSAVESTAAGAGGSSAATGGDAPDGGALGA